MTVVAPTIPTDYLRTPALVAATSLEHARELRDSAAPEQDAPRVLVSHGDH